MSDLLCLLITPVVVAAVMHRRVKNFWLASVVALGVSVPVGILLCACFNWYPEFGLFLPLTILVAVVFAVPLVLLTGWVVRLGKRSVDVTDSSEN